MVVAWTAPRTWVAGETVTAAMLNAQLRDNFKAITDPWTTYTPTISNGWTLGDGTITGSYIQIGNTVHFRIEWAVGSGTKHATNGPILSLPLPVKLAYSAFRLPFFASFGTPTQMWYGRAEHVGSSSVSLWYQGYSSARGSVTATAPVTWVAGSAWFTVHGTYEVA